MSTPTATKNTFEVLHTSVILADRRAAQPFSSIVQGDVARLSDGRTVGRVRCSDGDGGLEFAYAPFHEDSRLGGEFSAQPMRWAARMKAEIETMNVVSGMRRLEPTSFQTECAAFRKQFPAIASFMGLERNRPTPIFSVGATMSPIRPPQGIVPHEDVWAFLDRFQAGDWGLNGTMDFTPLTPEEAWCVDMLPVTRRNAAAVLTGNGIIRGDFPLSDAIQAAYRKSLQGDVRNVQPVVLKIWTLLRNGQGTSMVKVGAPEAS
jgi:hypothetical protein